MNMIPVFVGLDYHQDSVQVCVLDSQGKQLCNRSVKNDAGAIKRIATQRGLPRRIAIEACCGAANLAEELASRWCLPVQLAHSGYVNRMKRSPDKTDWSDAQLLADLVRVNFSHCFCSAPQTSAELDVTSPTFTPEAWRNFCTMQSAYRTLDVTMRAERDRRFDI